MDLGTGEVPSRTNRKILIQTKSFLKQTIYHEHELHATLPTITCSKSTMKTSEQRVESAKS